MAKRATPEPFRYRGRWRAQVTLANGERPSRNFDTKVEAADWIVEKLANCNAQQEPELGGPTTATLAAAGLGPRVDWSLCRAGIYPYGGRVRSPAAPVSYRLQPVNRP